MMVKNKYTIYHTKFIKMKLRKLKYLPILLGLFSLAMCMNACKPKGIQTAVSGDAAVKAYVPPGKYDEFYNFVSGDLADKCLFMDCLLVDYFE